MLGNWFKCMYDSHNVLSLIITCYDMRNKYLVFKKLLFVAPFDIKNYCHENEERNYYLLILLDNFFEQPLDRCCLCDAKFHGNLREKATWGKRKITIRAEKILSK